ncbi:UNVERIFIED_CONTAM: hypothetical protein Slati_3933100 [Sesamum latifolium]|uniref:Secreted protein n=1 Tax=Sesamum latifolium TaxID=2727402 RepID=A0AAW2TPD8_9LAMI
MSIHYFGIYFVVLIRYVYISVKHHNKAHRPTETTVQQLDRALDGDHEINCPGLGLERFKSRTSRMGIESPVETCIKSRIHWMGVVFHRPQTWIVYAILMGWLTRCQAD